MGLKGNLETFLLSSILQLLHNDRKTGALQVKNAEHWVSVIIQEGEIVYAMSSYRQVRLGNLLREEGVITLEQLEQCLEEGKIKKVALGKVLLEKEYISIQQLTQFIRQQVEEIIYHLFFWDTGDFEYTDARLDLSGLIVTNLDIMEVMLEASRRVDEMSVLKKHIPSSDLVFKQTGTMTGQQTTKLAAEENRMLRLVNGQRTVDRLLEESGLVKFDGYRILHSLIMSGAIEKTQAVPLLQKPVPPPQKPAPQDDYSALINGYTDIMQIIWQSLEPELGKETEALFKDCFPEALPGQKYLFKNFNANSPGPTNAYNVETNLKAIKNLTNIRLFLVESFNRFILNILDRVPDILGATPTLTTLRKIEASLPYITKYMADLKVTNSISGDLNRIIEKVEQQLNDDKKNRQKSAGILSMFKKI